MNETKSEELRQRWFNGDLPLVELMEYDKETLVSLLWYLRGYFAVDIGK